MGGDFNLTEETLALQDESNYHISNDRVAFTENPDEIRVVLDGVFIKHLMLYTLLTEPFSCRGR